MEQTARLTRHRFSSVYNSHPLIHAGNKQTEPRKTHSLGNFFGRSIGLLFRDVGSILLSLSIFGGPPLSLGFNFNKFERERPFLLAPFRVVSDINPRPPPDQLSISVRPADDSASAP